MGEERVISRAAAHVRQMFRARNIPAALRRGLPTGVGAVSRLMLGAVLGSALAGAAAARDLHVDPGAAGQGEADGTAARPYPGVAMALAAGLAAGDRLLLHPGDYGTVAIRGRGSLPPVAILPAPEAASAPRLTGLELDGVQGWSVEGLLIESAAGADGGPLVSVGAEARDIRLIGLTIRSGTGHETWDAETWRAQARTGIYVRGPGAEIRDNRLGGVLHGIVVHGAGARVVGNLVDGFARDGMRGLGDDGLYERNLVQNCVQIDKNHPDGFQSWSTGPDGKPGGGVVRGVVLRGNVILNHTRPRTPLTCHLQGIGLHTGDFADWLIEGNRVEVDAWTGISVQSGENVRILNNIVKNQDPGPPGPPSIQLIAARDDLPTGSNAITGNRATTFKLNSKGRGRTDPRITVFRDNVTLPPVR